MIRKILPFLLLSVLLLAVAITSMRKKSITADELAHIPAGCTYVQFRDYHLNPEHPPFVKLLSGLALDPKHPRLETYNWRNANQWRYGDIFFDDNDADTMLFRGRLPVVLLSLLLAFAVYCCAWEFYGWKAGCLALLLYVINPDMLAHGQLVTTDLGVTCFMFISIYTFWRALQRLTILRGLVTCIAVGLTLSTKFSGILVIPMLMMIGLVHALSKNPLKIELPKAGALLTQPVKKGLAAAGLLVAAGAVSLAIIWANYGFRYAISPNPEISSDLKWSTFWTIPGATIEAARFAKDIHLVPEAYIYGLVYVLKYSVRRMGFLLGATSMTGWWYYFPITFLVKTPLGLLLLILLGALFIRRYGAGWPVELTLLLPVAFYFAVAMATNMNIGHRHLLPIYPFLIVFASKMARALDPPRHRILGYVVAALVAWNVGATAYIYPHFLADRRRAESRMDVAGGFQPRLGAGPESAGGILQTAPREKFLPLVFRKRRPEILRSAECQAAAELSAEE